MSSPIRAWSATHCATSPRRRNGNEDCWLGSDPGLFGPDAARRRDRPLPGCSPGMEGTSLGKQRWDLQGIPNHAGRHQEAEGQRVADDSLHFFRGLQAAAGRGVFPGEAVWLRVQRRLEDQTPEDGLGQGR